MLWNNVRAVATAAVLALGASAFGAGSALAADRQVEQPLRAISGDQARVTDALGRTVLLRGVNVNQLGEYYQEWADLPTTFPLTERDFAEISALGMNAVRLIVHWSRLEPQRGRFNTEYTDQIGQALAWARKHDIYVLLDMHQDAWSKYVGTPNGVSCPSPFQPAVGWDGAPRWATALVGSLLTCRGPLREISLSVALSFQRFYDNHVGLQDALAKTWAQLAARFADDPVVAGYDLLNEPNPGLLPGFADRLGLVAYYRRAIAAIRAAEKGRPGGFAHTIYFEPPVVGNAVAIYPRLPSIRDENAVFAPHLYNESIFPLGGTIEQGFREHARAAKKYRTTFFSGEWGWFGNPAADQAKIARYVAEEDRYRVGGTWWQWRQACGDPHANTVRRVRPQCPGEHSDGLKYRSAENKMLLSRAFPRAAPGVLTLIEATAASGALTIAGIADRAGVPADLWVPARCANPVVSGENVGAAALRTVTGGWRVSVAVPAPGAYRVRVDCSSQERHGDARSHRSSHADVGRR